MTLSLNSVNLATLAVATLFYGMYAVLFFISMYLLVRKYHSTHTSQKSRKNGSVFKSTVFVSAILLFLVVTVHWTIIVYRAFFGFVSLNQGVEAEIFFADQTKVTAVVQNSVLAVAVFIGDWLIIHRLWVVWASSKLVLVVPSVSIVATTVSSFISTYNTSHTSDIFGDPWLKFGTIMTLVTNMYCTAFITWKIWTITRISMPSDGTNLRHFLIIVIESAGFYALWAVLFGVCYESQSNLQLILIQTGPTVVGLVNALIHTRVGLGWTSEQMQRVPDPSTPLRFKFSARGEEV
ncbi:hypothetical protein B0H11DRAFT_2204729 [Mycena galericulata]|nr:hypothetical protein B0H11DRAFT_2204729 [Mycena galericulata]